MYNRFEFFSEFASLNDFFRTTLQFPDKSEKIYGSSRLFEYSDDKVNINLRLDETHELVTFFSNTSMNVISKISELTLEFYN